MKRLYVALLCVLSVVAVSLWSPNVDAFLTYSSGGVMFNRTGNCATCHGDFNANPYNPALSDGQNWGSSLMTLHQALVSNDCDVCHTGAGFNPVFIDDSNGGTGLLSVSCIGCHGRISEADNDAISSGQGAGLRQHHWNAGEQSCQTTPGCHTDANPAATPALLGENVLPEYYANPGTGHPNMPTDPCNPGGSENMAGLAEGLDNDGDNVYDGADSDCGGVPSADVALTKTASPDPVEVGNNLVYTLSITNNGPDAANVTLDDTLPANATFVSAVPSQGTCNPPAAGVVSCDLGTVSSGGSATVTITVTPTTQGQITNSATLTGSGNDPDLSNNSDSTTTTVNPSTGPSADISVTKSVDDASPDEGATITYTVTVTNQSSTEDATGVVVTDTLPSGVTYVFDDGGGSYIPGTGVWSVGSLTATSSDTLNITATVDAVTAGTTITNTATRTASSPNDPTAANDSDTADITPGPFADLSITKTVDVANPGEGSTIIYTINGPDDATGVEVTDLLPSGVTYVSDDGGLSYDSGTGVWSVGNLTASSSGTLNIDATVDSLPEGSSITNTATITASTPIDPDSTDDSASVVISRPGGGGGGGCALIAYSGGVAGAAGTFGLLLIAAGWFLVRRRKKE
jgi:uncharacterized repeat protein (TIGR01451 family)